MLGKQWSNISYLYHFLQNLALKMLNTLITTTTISVVNNEAFFTAVLLRIISLSIICPVAGIHVDLVTDYVYE